MKYFLKATVLLAAFAAFTAHAETFDFSYVFNDSSTITGSLSGDLNGSYVQNITDVHVFLNGAEFSGSPLFHAGWNTATHDFDGSIQALVSPVASLNNFIFADANVPTDYNASNFFSFLNDSAVLDPGQQVFANNLNTNQIAFDGPSNASWSLTAVPVPLPAAGWLMLYGLGLLGGISRRRRQR